MAAAAIVLLTAAGCPSPPADQAPVRPGAYCAPEGASGETADGVAMACTHAPGDRRNRWRTDG